MKEGSNKWLALKTYINVGLHISADQMKKKKRSKDYVLIYHDLKAWSGTQNVQCL